MEDDLRPIERDALKATSLPAFQVNLYRIRSTVKQLLSEWKSASVFQEYTDHSFNHVEDMLDFTSKVIPEETKAVMTPGDWFMLVMAIYFHGLGLLVTPAEFNNRGLNPDFRSFKSNPLLPSDKQKDYDLRLAGLTEADADRLLYSDFVRHNHGKRVRAWIDGTILYDGDPTTVQRAIVQELLSHLDYAVKTDLAILCESHTTDDVDDTSIYKVSQPYGGEKETVNLQYCAIILRTVDLLQISRRRASSALFQLVNPSDPQSQIEWLRHGAVRTVRPAYARDKDGQVDKTIQSDTIEVHAVFQEPNGFFGLTNYLHYATRELHACYNANQRSSKDIAEPYKFPWRKIDTAGIATKGFLTEQFEFELDQNKILDLLTGHTLYNDTTVVLRELTQNALDAVRLQCRIDNQPPETAGHVRITWSSQNRALTVSDNGTGMTQEVIVRHLLKVGSSRYQDAKFQDKYPDFHSISRFGIGVLSAFMVSDDVEITTCSEEEPEARRIAFDQCTANILSSF